MDEKPETTKTADNAKQKDRARTKLKNLATCKPSEFLKQTYRIKQSAEKWLSVTNIIKIRKNVPKPPVISNGISDEEKETIEKKYQDELVEAGRRNLSEMYDAIAGEHPEETLELLALCCFVEPENVDDYEIGDYLESISVMLGHKATISFFISLMRLGRIVMPAL